MPADGATDEPVPKSWAARTATRVRDASVTFFEELLADLQKGAILPSSVF
ncbi:hypothetical protein ABW21_db0202951 [Orbilia brochopaga]|nr:hypothetical protein ABW21_db0202951 [Drechslerella brochopaga]